MSAQIFPSGRPSLLGMDAAEIHERWVRCAAEPVPSYRVDQLLRWIYRHGVTSFEDMTNLSGADRQRLGANFVIQDSEILVEHSSTDGTRKLLLGWRGGGLTEAVMIPDSGRRTACISTQVGCPVQCTFCASGLNGLERNLSAAEIVEQVLRLATLCAGQGTRLSNVVIMGLGEPLANYDNTVKAIRTINAPWGVGLGARKITLSTVGLPSQIRRLANENIQITLALSLHAPNDDLRRRLIPWAERLRIRDVLNACSYYWRRTRREITIEYILLDGVNNLDRHAAELADICRRLRCNVNLIPYNVVKGLTFVRPRPESVQRFKRALRSVGVNAHVRRSRGLDIDAACGQLRRGYQFERQPIASCLPAE